MCMYEIKTQSKLKTASFVPRLLYTFLCYIRDRVSFVVCVCVLLIYKYTRYMRIFYYKIMLLLHFFLINCFKHI